MFANTQLMGLDTGFPDVCLTPTPAGPVPIPNPDIAAGMPLVSSTCSMSRHMWLSIVKRNMARLVPAIKKDWAAARLVMISIVIAMGALIASEWLARRATRRLHGN